MFFYPEDYLRLRDAVAARGCDVPIIAGIMPILSVAGIERAAALSGARIPPELAADLHAHAEDKAAVREIGVEYAARMCERLLAQGVPGLHFYTLNGSRATREIYELLGLGSGAQGQHGAHHRVGRAAAGEAEPGEQVGEAHAEIQAAGRHVVVLGGQHRGALRAPGAQRQQQAAADAAVLVLRPDVQLSDLQRVGQPARGDGGAGGGRDARPDHVVPPLAGRAAEPVAEGHGLRAGRDGHGEGPEARGARRAVP